VPEKATGKIANNAQAGGVTLGVAALNLGGQKLKCAVSGAPGEKPRAPLITGIRLSATHLDKVGTGEPQSRITFKNYFASPPAPTGEYPAGNPFGPFSFTFEELSIPDPATARGAFVGADPASSSITITGDHTGKLRGRPAVPATALVPRA